MVLHGRVQFGTARHELVEVWGMVGYGMEGGRDASMSTPYFQLKCDRVPENFARCIPPITSKAWKLPTATMFEKGSPLRHIFLSTETDVDETCFQTFIFTKR